MDAFKLGLVKPQKVPKLLNLPPAVSAPAVSIPLSKIQVESSIVEATSNCLVSPYVPLSLPVVESRRQGPLEKMPVIPLPRVQLDRSQQNQTSRIARDKQIATPMPTVRTPKVSTRKPAKDPSKQPMVPSKDSVDDFVLRALNNAKVEACISSVVEETHLHKLSEQKVVIPRPKAASSRSRAIVGATTKTQVSSFKPFNESYIVAQGPGPPITAVKLNVKKALRARMRSAAQKKCDASSMTANRIRPPAVTVPTSEARRGSLPTASLPLTRVSRAVIDDQTRAATEQQPPESSLRPPFALPTDLLAENEKKVAKLILFKSKMHETKKMTDTQSIADRPTGERPTISQPKLGPLKIKLHLSHARDKKKKKDKKTAKLRGVQNLSNRAESSNHPLLQKAAPAPETERKVPKLILKLPTKLKDIGKVSEMLEVETPKQDIKEDEVDERAADLRDATSAAPSTSSCFQPWNVNPEAIAPSLDQPLDLTKHASELVVVASPKSLPSPPSRSPEKSPAVMAAVNSPVPPTPSPRSSTPSSPIHVDVVVTEVKAAVEVMETPTGEQKYEESPPRAKTPTFPLIPPVSSPVREEQHPVAQPSEDQVQQGDEEFKDDGDWLCPECLIAYKEGVDMVACDGCDNWFHWDCVGLVTAPPENENWYCKECVDLKCTRRSSSKSGSSKVNGPMSKRKRR
ncbi:unnamed protein product [Soboliphyme baturini]|uniref:PHD-type domain-containing protein n=1 Tax=Soboliphyme baturini TaxID=241478 RepID=A0A183IZX6_9BILA|nr:unnamed protein product [Soboliphyme baturini]